LPAQEQLKALATDLYLDFRYPIVELCGGVHHMSVLHAALALICDVFADPGARTTDSSVQDAVLQAAAALGRPLFALFNHPAARVADGTAVIMRAIAERGAAAAAPMRDAALREGAVLQHLQLALFASGAREGAICTTALPRVWCAQQCRLAAWTTRSVCELKILLHIQETEAAHNCVCADTAGMAGVDFTSGGLSAR
jgi:hypothetical protein